MSSYLALRNITPDRIISSCALRAQTTAETLAEKIGYQNNIDYMNELYLTRPEMLLNVISTQEDIYETIFLIGHNPSLTELVKLFIKDKFTKFPTLGIMAIELYIDSWDEINDLYEVKKNSKIDFFIFPKQFKYFLPLQIKQFITYNEKYERIIN